MKEREINVDIIGKAMGFARYMAFQIMNSDEAPTVYPHVLLLLSSVVYGASQAMAVMVSETTKVHSEEASEGEKVEVSSIIPTAVNDDTMAFSLLLTLRMNRAIAGPDGGVLTEISPSAVAGAMSDFNKLYGRDPGDLNSLIHQISEMGRQESGYDMPTHLMPRSTHLN
jgi:hypothetical protein